MPMRNALSMAVSPRHQCPFRKFHGIIRPINDGNPRPESLRGVTERENPPLRERSGGDARGGSLASMFNWGRIVEEQIRDAQQKGEFDDLAGQGKPLVTNDEETALEGDLKMAHHILKNADALPLWIEMNKEI